MDSHLFSLKYVAQIINELKFTVVEVHDPHSNVLPALLNRCRVIYPMTYPINVNKNNYDLYFYPDNGAAKKYSEILDMPYRFGNKKRNLDTGEIVCYEVIADKADIEGKRILIVDDMVMGGRTFVEAAKALREMGASQVDLYVTHLKPESRKFYNSKGNGLIDNIYSADTLEMIQYFNMPEPRP
ncbi:MAG: phosphoribosyltransferase [Paludibacteraceae bacterium]|nr:phosphoribosyltransferase [Paludibacteraceae bacterium]